MNKKELLSPCGNMESLYQAVHNGADAVYLGGKRFGARAYANNFDNEEMIKAIKYCHLYDVKIYVTVNTIIYEEEFKEALEYVEFLYVNGVDAIIMQDIGLIERSKKMFPNLEIHASTQGHNQNNEGISLLKELGISRVVLARELSLKEINNITVDIEKEVFIHGALCVSYSGCCLMSSLNGSRSGNRGECTGCCRLPYELYCEDKKIDTKDKYLLSTRELNTSLHLKELLDSDIKSFKIEGRMKSPEYVGFVTRLYRKLIDKYYNKEDISINKEDILKLEKLYNRKFTSGYIFENNQSNIMNIETSNHIGIDLGNVIYVDNKKIKVKLKDTLNQGDGIRFGDNTGMTVNMLYNEKGLLVNSIPANDIVILDNKVNLDEKTTVLKTIDYNLVKEIQNYPLKRIPIIMSCTLNTNKPLTISINDGKNNVIVTGNIVNKAINAPITKGSLTKQLDRLNDTPFIMKELNINTSDDSFIPIKDINELRRKGIEELIKLRENKNKNIIINSKEEIKVKTENNKPKISILVRSKEQFECAINKNIDNIYITDYKLYEENKNIKNLYYKVPKIIQEFKDLEDENLLVTELGAINKYANKNKVVSDYSLNIANINSVNVLKNKYNIENITLSIECSNETINLIASSYNNIEIIIYGRIEAMVMKYCPLKMLINKNKETCNICKTNKKYYLKDSLNRSYPILNEREATYIMDNKNIDRTKYIKDYINMKISNFRIELFDEDYKQTEKIINKIIGDING